MNSVRIKARNQPKGTGMPARTEAAKARKRARDAARSKTRRTDPEYRAKEGARNKAWRDANPDWVKAYRQTYEAKNKPKPRHTVVQKFECRCAYCGENFYSVKVDKPFCTEQCRRRSIRGEPKPTLTEEERKANTRASQIKWRQNNPDKYRALKRAANARRKARDPVKFRAAKMEQKRKARARKQISATLADLQTLAG